MDSDNQEIQLKPMSEHNLAHQRSPHGQEHPQLHGYVEDQPKEWAMLDYYLEVDYIKENNYKLVYQGLLLQCQTLA